ncbi:MAG TPA: vWA domain-containing protein [Kofleriaceae bacterium]|nr:vWA domain-containing protein [Kofleriaceae bacterium]
MSRLLGSTLAAALSISLLAGCPDREVVEVVPVPDNVLDKSVPVNLNRNLDLLFVIDNSGSMAAEQASLARNFPEFINVLNTIPGGLPDVHIGVVSSNVGAAGASGVPGCSAQGDDGNLQVGLASANCAATYGLQGTFISDIAQQNGSRTQNYNGDLPGLFSCMATVGTGGCGFEMHLESAWRALQPGKNPGFYRQDAYLGVIFVADEDDCSTEMGAMFGDPTAGLNSPLGPRTSFRCHEFGVVCENDPNPRAFGNKTGCKARDNSQYQFEVEKYVNFFRTLKSDPSLVIVAGILGTFDAGSGNLTVGQDPAATAAQGTPAVQRSCGFNPNDEHAGASPPVRIAKFLTAFPDRNTQTSICDENLSDALVQIAALLKLAIGDPCIDTPLADRNPDRDGDQYECTVLDVTNPNSDSPVETVIPQCGNPRTTPCWELVEDEEQCPMAWMNYAIKVDRGGATPPTGTVMRMQCVTESTPSN